MIKHTKGSIIIYIYNNIRESYDYGVYIYILLDNILLPKTTSKLWSDIDKYEYRHNNSKSDKLRIIQQQLYSNEHDLDWILILVLSSL